MNKEDVSGTSVKARTYRRETCIEILHLAQTQRPLVFQIDNFSTTGKFFASLLFFWQIQTTSQQFLVSDFQIALENIFGCEYTMDMSWRNIKNKRIAAVAHLLNNQILNNSWNTFVWVLFLLPYSL